MFLPVVGVLRFLTHSIYPFFGCNTPENPIELRAPRGKSQMIRFVAFSILLLPDVLCAMCKLFKNGILINSRHLQTKQI